MEGGDKRAWKRIRENNDAIRNALLGMRLQNGRSGGGAVCFLPSATTATTPEGGAASKAPKAPPQVLYLI